MSGPVNLTQYLVHVLPCHDGQIGLNALDALADDFHCPMDPRDLQEADFLPIFILGLKS